MEKLRTEWGLKQKKYTLQLRESVKKKIADLRTA